MPTSSCSGGSSKTALGGLGVHVLAALEDLAQHVLAGDVGEHAQLDLRVVDAQQHVAGLGDEAGADLAAGLGADRDVLQVRVDRREPARGGVDLQERRVDAPVGGDVGGQRVEVGLHELGELAEALDLGDDLVLGADRLQHARVGGEAGLAAALAREAELDEQHLGELLRRADHELLARELPDLALELGGVGADAGGGLLQAARVELDAGLLGLAQHADQRQLDLGQQAVRARARRSARAGGRRARRSGRRAAPGRRRRRRRCRAPRPARRAGSRAGRGRAGRPRSRCRRRGWPGPRRAPWPRARAPGARPAAATSSAGSSTLPTIAAPPCGESAAKRQPVSAGSSSPSGMSGGEATSTSSSPGSLATSAGVPSRASIVRASAASGRGISSISSIGERLLEPAQRVAQLPVAEHGPHAGAVDLARHLDLEVDVDRHVADHRRELLGEPRGVGVLGEVLLALGAGDLVDAGQHGLEVAEALQQVRGRLVADARDAGDVVGGVALEPDEVRDQLRRDAVAVDHALAVVDLRVGHAAARAHDPHAVVDELVGVAVARDDHHGDPALLGLLGERGDHVVGLVALDGDVAVAERLHERAQVRPLELEQVGPATSAGPCSRARSPCGRTSRRPTRRPSAPGRSR